MAEYAYTTATGKIRSFLDKIQEVGVPPKATQTWLVGIGFASTNDRPFLSIMRQIGFVDASGRPTSLWEEFRGGSSGALARGIRQGYSALFETYPDAHRRSNGELENIVKMTAPKLGKDAVSRAILTFKALTATADFSQNGGASVAATGIGTNGSSPQLRSSAQPLAAVPTLVPGLTINVNVQLTLPETTDGVVYERLFAAMREHLMNGSSIDS